MKSEEKNETECPSLFAPYDLLATLTPHTAVHATASDLLGLCLVRNWNGTYDKDTVAAARCCFARTRSGVVLPVFLPRGMHVSFE